MKNKFAICFFGINRSLSHVIDSIRANILKAVPSTVDCRIYGALMHAPTPFTNTRSEEFSCMVENNFEVLIVPSEFELIDQSKFDSQYKNNLDKIHLNDIYSDGRVSLMNMLREMYSIKVVWNLVSSFNPDCVLFLRPDLIYHDRMNIEKYLSILGRGSEPMVITPFWQKWGGLNDRFAFANLAGAKVYGNRFDYFWEYIPLLAAYPQAEAVLFTTMFMQGVNYLSTVTETASRVRVGGVIKSENFSECGDYKNLEKYLVEIRSKLSDFK